MCVGYNQNAGLKLTYTHQENINLATISVVPQSTKIKKNINSKITYRS